MKIAIIGTGYVGLVSGADFASRGYEVVCVDINEKRIEGLNRGVMPINEVGLPELVAAGVDAGRLIFSTDAATAIAGAEIVFCCVGTPLREDGRADCSMIYEVARMFGVAITKPTILVNKSTVPVGTAVTCEKIINNELKNREIPNSRPDPFYAVVANPEFLSQGTAVRDTANPSRIVIGSNDAWAVEQMKLVNASFIDAGVPVIVMSRESAELAKCAANAFLATKISFINEIANLCELVGANVDDIAVSMGLDKRIGPSFLQAGIGYGGGCIPKDTAALISTGYDIGYDFKILPAVQAVNEAQRQVMYKKLVEMMPERNGKRIAVWGLAFKPGTDDVRSSPALQLVEQLLADGAKVVAYDPAAQANAEKLLLSLQFATTPLLAVQNADALLICTEWPEFSKLELAAIAEAMADPLILDGRGVYRNQIKPHNLRYWTVGCG
jgi:UDPglucose 6-dehydrogenase